MEIYFTLETINKAPEIFDDTNLSKEVNALVNILKNFYQKWKCHENGNCIDEEGDNINTWKIKDPNKYNNDHSFVVNNITIDARGMDTICYYVAGKVI